MVTADHQERRTGMAGLQLLPNAAAVQSGQGPIQHHGVERLFAGDEGQGLDTVLAAHRREASRLQDLAHVTTNFRVVVHHQNTAAGLDLRGRTALRRGSVGGREDQCDRGAATRLTDHVHPAAMQVGYARGQR